MVCSFDPKVRCKKLLDFSCNSDWASATFSWTDCRKRKIISKKEKPSRSSGVKKLSKPKNLELSKPKKPIYLKAIESKSAGPTGRDLKKPTFNPLDLNRKAVKCKVVSFHGSGTKLCVTGAMRVQSVPNVGEQWTLEEGMVSDRSNASIGSTINLDSGSKNSKFVVNAISRIICYFYFKMSIYLNNSVKKFLLLRRLVMLNIKTASQTQFSINYRSISQRTADTENAPEIR